MIRALTLGLFLAALAACQEQGPARPFHVEKGVYQGHPDTPLSPAQVDALRQRAAIQRF